MDIACLVDHLRYQPGGYGGTYPPLSMGMEPLGPWGIKLAKRLGPWGIKLAIRLAPWGIKLAIRLGYGPFRSQKL